MVRAEHAPYNPKIMPEYRRWFEPGATYFFTVVTHERRPLLTEPEARTALRNAISVTQRERPFKLFAIALLSDHLHCVWDLPRDDEDFTTRWRLVKARFSQFLGATTLGEGTITDSRRKRGERGFW